ncbi:MAG: exodeoxyribonuclease VII small subunit [Lachnospiraceae bacterium]|jgi:exodeoxyribonuclease VII small subunit|nr:exodeoxyribonuclease VII small subunit [Lachnospiraceae bacterium]
MGEEKKELSLEENFARLEEIIERLGEEIALEEAFRVYGEGMAVLKQCNEQIDRVEKQVLKMSAEGQLEEFEHGYEGI